MMDDVKRRKAAFRTAFDYMERQLQKMPAFASSEKYWTQAWAEVLQLSDGADELTMELLATAYWELERIWKARDIA